MNSHSIKGTKHIKKPLNDKHDIFNFGNDLSMTKISEVIEDNISAFHQNHPFYFFSYFIHKKRYGFLEKFKVLLLSLDFLCDEERVSLDREAFIKINSARFITQKFVYTLIRQYEEPKLEEYSSILWITSLGKTLIDTLSFNSQKWPSIGLKIKNSFNEDVMKLWKKWSNMVKKPFKNPYLKNGEYRFDILYRELFTYLDPMPKIVIDRIITLTNDKEIKELFNILLKFIDCIENKKYEKIMPLPKLKINKNNEFEYIMKNEFKQFLIISNVIGYPNHVFLRSFIPILNDVSEKEKKALASLSHENLYEEMAILKYDKIGNWVVKNQNEKQLFIIKEFIKKIFKYFQ